MKFRFYALKLVVACVLVFIIQVIFNSFTELFVLNQRAYFEPWRFISAIFLHAGLSHLIFNMFALALFGSILERFIGGWKFLLDFFTTGILANVISVLFYPSSLGASGAIMGVIGALIVVSPLMIVWAFGLPMPLFIAGILWAGGDLIGLFDSTSGIGHIAHLSGIFFGLLLGLSFRDWRRKKNSRNAMIKLDERYMRSWEDSYLK